ncbi:MAG: hypothetical protein M1338_01805 [Patescibacteria group bacterium]|nr:hypothetical protein [Patescibacteria group bacterium]
MRRWPIGVTIEAKNKIIAIVTKVVEQDVKKSYVVTRAIDHDIGSITFSLTDNVWQESRTPAIGDIVILDDMRLKRGGWRASHARFPSHHEQSANSNKEES